MVSNTHTTLVQTCYRFFSILVSHFEKIWEVLGRELYGTFPIAAGAGLKECCASINFSTYPTGPGIRVFSSSFPHACHVRYLILFCGWSKFSMLIFTWRRTRIDVETLQNFMNEQTVDLENIQRIQKKEKGEFTRCEVSSNLVSQTWCQNPSMSNLTTCNESTIFFLC